MKIGAYSCFDAGYISAGLSTNCYGLLSCAFVDKLAPKQRIYCGAEMACYASNIKLNENYNLGCWGDKSCADAVLEISNNLWLDAYLGAENAIITCVGTPVEDMEVYIGAFAIGSLDGTEIICSVNTSCQIDCYNYACNNIKSIKCDNCTSIEFICTYAEKSIYCPHGI